MFGPLLIVMLPPATPLAALSTQKATSRFWRQPRVPRRNALGAVLSCKGITHFRHIPKAPVHIAFRQKNAYSPSGPLRPRMEDLSDDTLWKIHTRRGVAGKFSSNADLTGGRTRFDRNWS